MNDFEKIVVLENEIEALSLGSELESQGIPHAMHSYRDTALDGLYQFSSGWGHVEAPPEYREQILNIVDIIRKGDST